MLRTTQALISLVVTLLVSTHAFAQAAPGGAAPSPLMQLIPFIAIFGIMYFMMIRPQAKKAKMHQQFLSNLKRGDEVLTSGGLFGRVEGLTDMFITLEIAPNTRIKILRTQIMSYVPTATSTTEVKA